MQTLMAAARWEGIILILVIGVVTLITGKAAPESFPGGSSPRSLSRTVASFAPLALAVLASHAVVSSPVSSNGGSQPHTLTASVSAVTEPSTSQDVPSPLLKSGMPVDWFFVFKFNSASFPGCGGDISRQCPFGGTVQPYSHFGQQFAYASSADHTLQQGQGCIGDTTSDPVGATFDRVYNGDFFYAIWNDQFYGDPISSEFAPTGHSKGILAWDTAGNGMLMQVSTPSWPAAGSQSAPRKTDGNTLGFVKDNDVLVSQHFFALKLNKSDVAAVLSALGNASVVTSPDDPQIVNNGGPTDIQELVKGLGAKSASEKPLSAVLSSGVQVISKPSRLHVPPWQMVSAMLAGEPLRVASWWTRPEIPTTSSTTDIACWDPSLGKRGAVEIATSGTWAGAEIGLEGLDEPNGNHAKIGVSTGTHDYVIFGDMNQQGAISGTCNSSQNGRGGLFFVVEDHTLAESVRALISGNTAPSE